MLGPRSTTASRCHPLAELSVEIGVITVSVSSSLTERTSDDDISDSMHRNEIAGGGSCSRWVPIGPPLLFSTFDGWSFRPAHQLDSPFGHFLRLTNMSRRTRLCDGDGSHDQVLTKTPVEGLANDTSSQSSVARRGLAGPPRPRTWRRRRTDFAAIVQPERGAFIHTGFRLQLKQRHPWVTTRY